MAEVNRLEWDAYIKDSELMASLRRIERNVGGMVDNVAKKGRDMEDVFARMAKVAAGFFTVNAAQGFVQELINVRSQFQQLDIAFTTMLGSKEKADQLTKDLIQFASTTPFGMKDTATAAKQLLAYGSAADEVKNELRMLGDVASGTSQPIGELVYLYGTLKTQGRAQQMDINQFAGRGIPIYKELAKVLEINVSQVRDFVSAGKVGFAEVQQAFQNMTAQGSMFGGLMEAQSKTIQGELERLGDAYDQMLNKIGAQTEGTISEIIKGASVLIENYETVLELTVALIATYGAYRAALITTTAVQQVVAARAVGMTAAEMLHLGAITAKTAAMKVLNAVMLSNPAILLTAGVVGLTAAIYALTQVTDATSAAQEKLSEAQETGASRADQERRSVEQLIAVLKDNTATVEQKKAAYDKLQSQTKGILSSFSQEEIAVGKATSALDLYIKQIGRAASARKAFDEFNALAEKMDDINRKGIDGVGIWSRTGRALQNAFGANGVGAAKNFWGFGEEGKKGDQFIVDQERENIKTQMDLLSKEFDNEFKTFITGVEDAKPATKAGEELKKDFSNFSKILKSVSNKADLDALKKATQEGLEALAPGDAQIKTFQDRLKQIAKIESQYSVGKGKSDDAIANQQYQAAERYLSLTNDIANARSQMFRSQLSSDQQEIESAKDKYNALRDEVRKFNADPKNKTKIDGTAIDSIEKSDLTAITARQSNERKLEKYNEDYQNYVRYEQLKVTASEKYANEQYGKYSQTMDKMRGEYVGLAARKQITGLSGADDAYFKELGERIKAHDQKQQEEAIQRQTKAILDNRSYQEMLLALEDEFQRELDALGKNVTEDQKRIWKDRKEAEILQLQETEADKNKILNEGARKYLLITTANIVAQIKVVKDLLDSSDLSEGMRSQLESNLSKLQSNLKLGSTAANIATLKSKIADLQKELIKLSKTPGANPEEIKAINSEIVITQEEIDNLTNEKLKNLFQMLQKIAMSLGELGSAFSNLGDAYGNDALSGIGDALGGISANIDDISVAFDKNATSADKYAAAAQSLVSIISMVANASANRMRAEEEYYRAVIQMQNEYNLSKAEQLRLESELGESVYVKNYVGRVQDGMKSADFAIGKYKESIQELAKNGKISKGLENAVDWKNVGGGAASGAVIGGAIGSVVPVIGNIVGAAIGAIVGGIVGLFGGKKKKPKYEELYANLPKEIVDTLTSTEPKDLREVKALLESLNNDKAVDANTKQMIEGTLKWIEQIEKAREQVRGVVQELSGSLGNELRNKLVEAFKAGENAALAMGKTVDKVIEDMLSQLLFSKAFDALFKDLETKLTDTLVFGDENDIIDVFSEFLEKAGSASDDFYKMLEAAKRAGLENGMNIFGDSGKGTQGELSKGISGITENTANRLEAELGGLRIGNMQLLDISKYSFTEIIRIKNSMLGQLTLIQNNTLRTANNTDRLAGIEMAIVSLNSKVVSGDAIKRGAGL